MRIKNDFYFILLVVKLKHELDDLVRNESWNENNIALFQSVNAPQITPYLFLELRITSNVNFRLPSAFSQSNSYHHILNEFESYTVTSSIDCH